MGSRLGGACTQRRDLRPKSRRLRFASLGAWGTFTQNRRTHRALKRESNIGAFMTLGVMNVSWARPS